MSDSIGDVRVDLSLGSASFEQGIRDAAARISTLEAVSKDANTRVFEMRSRMDETAAAAKRYQTAGTAATGSFRSFGSVAQQAGYQVGDFAVQIASGQSALVAFTQQGAQLAGFFGPGGAVLGAVLAIGGAIAGYFVRSMGDGENATDALSAAVKRLDEVTSEADGIHTLTKEIRDLARESEVAARARIVSAMAAAEEAARSAAKGIRDALDGAVDTVGFSDLSDFFGAKNFSKALEGIQESLQLTGKEGRGAAAEIFTALQTLDASPTIENFRALESAIAETSTTIGTTSKPLQALVADLGQYFDGARSAEERTAFLKQALANLSDTINQGASDAVDKLVDKLRVQAETIGLTSLRMIEYNRLSDLKEATDRGATQAQLEAINASYARLAAYEAEIEALKELDAAMAREDQAVASAEAGLQAVISALQSETAAIDAAYLARMEKITAARQMGLETSISYDELELMAAMERESQLVAIADQGANERAAIERRHQDTLNSYRESGAQNAVGLLSVFAQKSKAAAFAALALQKGIAIAQVLMNTKVAAAAALIPPPIGLGPVAGAGLAASITAWGYANAGLIAATGIAQGAMMGGGGAPSGGGSSYGGGQYQPANPVIPGEAAASRPEVNIIFNGPVNDVDAERLANLLADHIENTDFVMVSSTSRNGQILANR